MRHRRALDTCAGLRRFASIVPYVTVFGWDIGGVNTKVARIAAGEVAAVRSRPYELQHAPHELARVLRELAAEVSTPGASPPVAFRCAVTMTAELSQVFRTKRAGVAFVLDAVETAFPSADVQVYTVDGGFLDPAAARRQALNVAAANWAATARLVGVYHPDAVLVDVGTTTTDIIPIVAGEPAALGRTDPDRLASGELVYAGAVRTPIEAIASAVPFAGGSAGVSAEGFALAGDVHVWRGDLDPADYGVATPDRRPVTRAFTGERLARVVCADRDLIDDRGVWAIADAVSSAQVDRIAAAVRRVSARHPAIATAVVTGLGAFLGDRAARAAGLDVVPLSSELGDSAARCAPAACVALLLDRQVRDGAAIDGQPVTSTPARSAASPPVGLVDVVVKLGGGVLAAPDDFEAALAAIGRLARERRVLVVPGGGPFADAVRNADRRL